MLVSTQTQSFSTLAHRNPLGALTRDRLATLTSISSLNQSTGEWDTSEATCPLPLDGGGRGWG
jgi:hypothetical protein